MNLVPLIYFDIWINHQTCIIWVDYWLTYTLTYHYLTLLPWGAGEISRRYSTGHGHCSITHVFHAWKSTMLLFYVTWAKSDPSFLTGWTLFLNIYMFFAGIFICRLHRGYKKVSTKISFSHQFATILMDQLLCNVTLYFISLFWWRAASTCILFTAFHLLLLFSSLLFSYFLLQQSPFSTVLPAM